MDIDEPAIRIDGVLLGVVLLQTLTIEQIILFLVISAMGLFTLILIFAYMIYGEEE